MKNSYLSIVLCAAALIFAPLATAADIPIEAGKEKGSISVASFNRIVKENPSQITIVDVRDDREFKKGSFPGAINLPVGDVREENGQAADRQAGGFRLRYRRPFRRGLRYGEAAGWQGPRPTSSTPTSRSAGRHPDGGREEVAIT